MRKSIEPDTNLVLSMRDIGYSFETAIADVIDNSISAGAKNIEIFAPPTTPLFLAVIDDGKGLTEQDITDALTLAYYSPTASRDKHDLGRFGLGLKTASWSQCKRLTVVSSVKGEKSAASVDLDEISKSNKWEARFYNQNEIAQIKYADNLQDNGTLILWEKLDRIEQATEDASISALSERLEEARAHLELVFHRYLAPEAVRKAVKISLNGNKLIAFDPFATKEPSTQIMPDEELHLGEAGTVAIRAYTLPHHSKLTKEEEKSYAYTDGYLKNQGFYLYREQRLIVWGTWFKMAKQHPSLNLSRIRIDIPNTMDELWKINIMKAHAQPPREVKKRLRGILDQLGSPSRQIYRKRGHEQVQNEHLPVWIKKQAQNKISYSLSTEHPIISKFKDSLDGEQKSRFDTVLELISTTLPLDTLFLDLGVSAEKVTPTAIEEESFYEILEYSYGKLREQFDPSEIFDILRRQEPFRSNLPKLEKYLQERGLDVVK